jgi:hypothetical protein
MATLYTRNRLGKQVIEWKEPSEQFRVAFQSDAFPDPVCVDTNDYET